MTSSFPQWIFLLPASPLDVGKCVAAMQATMIMRTREDHHQDKIIEKVKKIYILTRCSAFPGQHYTRTYTLSAHIHSKYQGWTKSFLIRTIPTAHHARTESVNSQPNTPNSPPPIDEGTEGTPEGDTSSIPSPVVPARADTLTSAAIPPT